MKASLVVLLLASAAAAGCAGGGPNPSLAAPKLVLQARYDGSVTVFIHSAFGEQLYEWIALSADNTTVNNRTQAFSLEESLNRTGFYLDAAAGREGELYVLRARIDVDPVKEEASVSFHGNDGEWADAESFDLPFERVLNRRAPE